MAYTEIYNVRLEAADDGGFILRYTEKTWPSRPNPFANANSNYNYEDCNEAFSQTDIDTAVAKFKDYAVKAQGNGEQSEEDKS